MTKISNKLQVRAELLSAVKKLEQGDKHTQEFLEEILTPLRDFTDKNTILDILIKEIISASTDTRFLILSFLIENLVPKEMLEAELWRLLEQPHINDISKSNIINILKDLGNQINYEKYTEYFENPDSVIDADTEKMLKSAIYNPEALIDFLDFIEALPKTDKNLLIDSLCEDYVGEELANLFIPVLYANPNSELCKYAIEKLGESRSELALQPLNFIMNFTTDNEIKSKAKKSISALKLSGIREDKTTGFYKKVFENSKIDEVYTSLPDGRGNVGILVSRKRLQKNSLQMFAVVFNDSMGLLDCFGFNDITTTEFDRIVNKFYSNQEKIGITPSVAKLLLENAEQKALKVTGKVSYEFVCWKKLLFDVETVSNSLNEVLSNKLENIDITSDHLKRLYSTGVFDKWFFHNSDNEGFDLLISKIVNILQLNKDKEQCFKKINSQTKLMFSQIWDEENIRNIEFRLLLTAYLLSLNGMAAFANVMYSIIFNEDVKKELLNNILKVSIHEFYLREKAKYQNTSISTNIFSKRNEANKTLVNKAMLDEIIKITETNWGY